MKACDFALQLPLSLQAFFPAPYEGSRSCSPALAPFLAPCPDEHSADPARRISVPSSEFLQKPCFDSPCGTQFRPLLSVPGSLVFHSPEVPRQSHRRTDNSPQFKLGNLEPALCVIALAFGTMIFLLTRADCLRTAAISFSKSLPDDMALSIRSCASDRAREPISISRFADQSSYPMSPIPFQLSLGVCPVLLKSIPLKPAFAQSSEFILEGSDSFPDFH